MLPAALTLPARHTAVDARLLPEIVDLYLNGKLADGSLAPRTATNYRLQLYPWFAFWRECESIHHHTLSVEILRSALDWIRTDYRTRMGKPLSQTSIYDCFLRLKQVLLWAFNANCTGSVNMADWVPKVDSGTPDQFFPDISQLTQLLAVPVGPYRLRDVACLAFLVSTGARRFEAALATIEDVEFLTPMTDLSIDSDHRGWVWLRRVKGDSEGKNGGRDVVFDGVAGLLLKAYIRADGRKTGPIFDLSDNAIGQMVDRHAAACGLGEFSPHALRRALADYWDERHGFAGRAVLKKQLGHAANSGDVTERHYISRNRKRVTREILKWHISPLAAVALDWREFPVHIPPP